MTKRTITIEEAKTLVGEILQKEFKHHENPFGWITLEEWRKSQGPINDWKENWILLPLFIVDERYLCCLDVGYGHDIVVDSRKEKVYWSTRGIFNDDFCFLSDYYGFPDGAFFYRVK